MLTRQELRIKLGNLSVSDIKARIEAFKLLFGECEVKIRGNYDCADGDYVFINYVDEQVTKIGRKYLTVDLRHEGRVKIDPTSKNDHSYNILILKAVA